jgi:hypothetical protein
MVDPNDPELLAAWQALLDKLKSIFKNDGQDAQTRPIAERQDQYSRAILEFAELLYFRGQRDLATHFHLLGEALHDAAEGRNPPLLKVNKRRGGQPDTNEIWRLRAHLCIGIQYLIASYMEQDKAQDKDKAQDEAVNLVVRKHGTQLQKLVRAGSRPKTDLKSSIHAWLREFATDATDNVALDFYKDGMRDLDQVKASADANRLQQAGLGLIEKTAMRAAQALKT